MSRVLAISTTRPLSCSRSPAPCPEPTLTLRRRPRPHPTPSNQPGVDTPYLQSTRACVGRRTPGVGFSISIYIGHPSEPGRRRGRGYEAGEAGGYQTNSTALRQISSRRLRPRPRPGCAAGFAKEEAACRAVAVADVFFGFDVALKFVGSGVGDTRPCTRQSDSQRGGTTRVQARRLADANRAVRCLTPRRQRSTRVLRRCNRARAGAVASLSARVLPCVHGRVHEFDFRHNTTPAHTSLPRRVALPDASNYRGGLLCIWPSYYSALAAAPRPRSASSSYPIFPPHFTCAALLVSFRLQRCGSANVRFAAWRERGVCSMCACDVTLMRGSFLSPADLEFGPPPPDTGTDTLCDYSVLPSWKVACDQGAATVRGAATLHMGKAPVEHAG
ncbi:hypothetical protein B0H14DRAFT_3441670 [Mycena olivaceomarginata]|nr:hypothetical protein B0H14DRAFT_3441670 [Mycena olivaceomarginata]